MMMMMMMMSWQASSETLFFSLEGKFCLFGKGEVCRRFFGYHIYGCNTWEFLLVVSRRVTGR